MPDYTLPREERLRSLKAIRRLFGEGHSGFVYPLRYVWAKIEWAEIEGAEIEGAKTAGAEIEGAEIAGAEVAKAEQGVEKEATSRPVEIMFSVPKKFHKRANRRNLLKRRMREAYRLERGSLCARLGERSAHVHIALIYSTKESHSYKTIRNAVQRILEQVSVRL